MKLRRIELLLFVAFVACEAPFSAIAKDVSPGPANTPVDQSKVQQSKEKTQTTGKTEKMSAEKSETGKPASEVVGTYGSLGYQHQKPGRLKDSNDRARFEYVGDFSPIRVRRPPANRLKMESPPAVYGKKTVPVPTTK